MTRGRGQQTKPGITDPAEVRMVIDALREAHQITQMISSKYRHNTIEYRSSLVLRDNIQAMAALISRDEDIFRLKPH